jgi:aminoglycoside phosphotransferase (APT) family kinase protein
VYRLAGVGPGGSAVVAKRCPRETARTEYAVYAEVLPQLPVSALRCFGLVAEDGPSSWLFLEEAGGEGYSRRADAHRALAGRWLGLLHAMAPRAEAARRLPDRGPGHYLGHLRAGRDAIRENLTNPALTADDRRALESLVALQDALESHWGQVAGLCEGAPRTLVHGDFKAKNLRVRPGPAGAALLCFDWQTAGWAVPAADLASQADRDHAAYEAVLRCHWPDVRPETLQRLAKVGRVFRALAATDWAARELADGWPEGPMQKLRGYAARLAEFLRSHGWGA